MPQLIDSGVHELVMKAVQNGALCAVDGPVGLVRQVSKIIFNFLETKRPAPEVSIYVPRDTGLYCYKRQLMQLVARDHVLNFRVCLSPYSLVLTMTLPVYFTFLYICCF